MLVKLLAVGVIATVPISGTVVRHFQPPACERCAGHRGVTLKTAPEQPVVATAGGVVEFSGSVGGRLYVVQRLGQRVRVTYGALTSTSVQQGQEVSAGETVGISGEFTYVSVRVGDVHVEPLRALGLGRPRLMPTM
jgi:murein DD-endopeptidase MepM/ murein hydrolase activator NlpD